MPRIFAGDVTGVVTFLRTLFGARGEFDPGRPTEMRIGDSIVMVRRPSGLLMRLPGSTLWMPSLRWMRGPGSGVNSGWDVDWLVS